jgi:uncharacterized short protein YbdD (DUF466 family)
MMPSRLAAWRDALVRAARVVRKIIGVPDYEAYVRHLAVAHPDRAPVDRDTFTRECQEARYSRPGSRCC